MGIIGSLALGNPIFGNLLNDAYPRDSTFIQRQEMISPQGEVLKVVRELEFDHHRAMVAQGFGFRVLSMFVWVQGFDGFWM